MSLPEPDPVPATTRLQAQFDDAVKDFIDSLDLNPAEAVDMAVEEFGTGADLSGVDRTWPPEDRVAHPVAVAFAAVRAGLDASIVAGCLEPAVVEGLDAVVAAVRAPGDEGARAASVAQAEFAATHVCRLLDALVKHSAADGASLTRVLGVIASLACSSKALRKEIVLEGGAQRLTAALTSSPWCVAGRPGAAAAVRAAEALAKKCEPAKVAFVEIGTPSLADLLVTRLAAPLASSEEGGTDPFAAARSLRRHIAGALAACADADDRDAPGSKAFAHGMKIGKDFGGIAALHAALAEELGAGVADGADGAAATSGDGAVKDDVLLRSLLRCLQKISVNDDLCGAFADLGGLRLTLYALTARGAEDASRRVAASAAGLLGQLLGRDSTESALPNLGYLELVPALAGTYAEHPEVIDPLLRVVSMVCLRLPELAQRCWDAGCVELACEALDQHRDNGPVCRQACQVVRNVAVRSEELRKGCLALAGGHLERRIRAARARHTEARDVGGAALRDLQLEYHGVTEKDDVAAGKLDLGNLDYYYSAL